MIRVNVICEGETERAFVRDVLTPYLLPKNLALTPRILGKGSNYDKLRDFVVQWMKEDQGAYVTTLIDIYGMNRRFPGYLENKDKPPHEKAIAIEAAVKADIERHVSGERRFMPYFQLHEFEALLFSSPDVLEEWLSEEQEISAGAFQSIRQSYPTPEHIDDSPQNAPSKRINRVAPFYNKVADGVQIAEYIGLACIRKECTHFNRWIEKLEALAES